MTTPVLMHIAERSWQNLMRLGVATLTDRSMTRVSTGGGLEEEGSEEGNGISPERTASQLLSSRKTRTCSTLNSLIIWGKLEIRGRKKKKKIQKIRKRAIKTSKKKKKKTPNRLVGQVDRIYGDEGGIFEAWVDFCQQAHCRSEDGAAANEYYSLDFCLPLLHFSFSFSFFFFFFFF